MAYADDAALVAVMICCGATIECARRASEHASDARIFVSLILFALTWAIFLPYYELESLLTKQQLPAEIGEILNFLAAFAAVLIVLSGSVLHREAKERRGIEGFGKYDGWALFALTLLVVPTVVPTSSFPLHPIILLVLQPLLTSLGYSLMVYAVIMLTKKVVS